MTPVWSPEAIDDLVSLRARPQRSGVYSLVTRGARTIDRCAVRPLAVAVPAAVAAIAPQHRESDPRCLEDTRRDDRTDQRAWVHAACRRDACRQRLAQIGRA